MRTEHSGTDTERLTIFRFLQLRHALPRCRGLVTFIDQVRLCSIGFGVQVRQCSEVVANGPSVNGEVGVMDGASEDGAVRG